MIRRTLTMSGQGSFYSMHVSMTDLVEISVKVVDIFEKSGRKNRQSANIFKKVVEKI
jgi:hypothetical protein